MSATRSLVFKTVSSLLGLVGLLTAITSPGGDGATNTNWGFGTAAHHVADDTHWGTPSGNDDDQGDNRQGSPGDDTHW